MATQIASVAPRTSLSRAEVANRASAAKALLRERREIMQLEWRDEALGMKGLVETPFRKSVFEQIQRGSVQADVALTCNAARRMSGR